MAIPKIKHYIGGNWIEGGGDGEVLHNAITGEPVAAHTVKGVDFGMAYEYARKVGNATLRKMTFQERGLMLKALAFHLMEKKEIFYESSKATGATRVDIRMVLPGHNENGFDIRHGTIG